MLTQHRRGSPAVTLTLGLQFPPCCQGGTVTWQGGADAFPSPQRLSWAGAPESLQKVSGFSSRSHGRLAVSCNGADRLLRRGIYLPHVTMLGEAGGSSKEGCVPMRTWGPKAVMSRRHHVGLRSGSLQASTDVPCKRTRTLQLQP